MNTTANRNTAATREITTIFDKAISFDKVEPCILYLAESVNGKQGIFLKLEHSNGNIFGAIRKVNPKRKVKAGSNKIIFKYYGQTYSLFLNEVMLIDGRTSRLFKMYNFRLHFEDADRIYDGLCKHFKALNAANQVKEQEEKPQTNQTVAPIDKELFDNLMGMAISQTGLTEAEVTEYVDYVTRYIQNKREEMNDLKEQIQEISEDISSKSSEFVLEIQKRKEIAEKRRAEEARKAAEEKAKKKQEEINSVREFLSGVSDDMIQYLKAQLGVEETKKSDKESDSLKGDINMKVRVVPSNNDDSWNFFAKHVREICDRSSLPNKEILERLVKKSDGMTLKEIADAMGFNSSGRIVRINDLLRKMKFDKILGTRVRKSGYKIAINKESHVNGGVTRKINCEIYNELVSESEYIK
jgi:cell division septum initiation protein DivIVA